jgi:bifunctional non-homologous end joining protein LigD
MQLSGKSLHRSETAREPVAPAPAGEVALTHATRLVYPEARISKGDVAAYYRAVARWMLPELVNRPLSLVRCPGGVGGKCFFQKHPASGPRFNVGTVALEERDGSTADYLFVRDRKGLLELVQMNVLEFHPWGARVDRPEAPDRIVFDLDPDEAVAWPAVVTAAREVRARLLEIGLQSFVRTSGGKGLHVVVPFRRGPDWAAVKRFCASFVDAMVTLQPQRYTASAGKAQRKGRIFIDWLRNVRGATSVCNWSLRARAGAPVAMPLRWEELGRVEGGGAYHLAKALRRASQLQTDPWAGIATLRQRLLGP